MPGKFGVWFLEMQLMIKAGRKREIFCVMFHDLFGRLRGGARHGWLSSFDPGALWNRAAARVLVHDTWVVTYRNPKKDRQVIYHYLSRKWPFYLFGDLYIKTYHWLIDLSFSAKRVWVNVVHVDPKMGCHDQDLKPYILGVRIDNNYTIMNHDDDSQHWIRVMVDRWQC